MNFQYNNIENIKYKCAIKDTNNKLISFFHDRDKRKL